MSDAIVKNLSFGKEASDKVFAGIEKLTKDIYGIVDLKNTILIYRCISVVCFELKIRDLEISLLNGEI